MKTAPENNPARLRHMVDYAQDARRSVIGHTRESFLDNRTAQLAVDKAIITVGEAANHVTLDVQRAHAGIPWSEIIGMRHRLVHRYFRTELEVLWDTVIEYLPNLVTDLERILADDRA